MASKQRGNPKIQALAEKNRSAADDHVALVVPDRLVRGLVPGDFEAVGPPAADLRVYRRTPEDVRRCPDGVPAPGTPYLSAGPVTATLEGCEETR